MFITPEARCGIVDKTIPQPVLGACARRRQTTAGGKTYRLPMDNVRAYMPPKQSLGLQRGRRWGPYPIGVSYRAPGISRLANLPAGRPAPSSADS